MKHIDQGVKGSCSRCPVALALADSRFARFWVGVNRITDGFWCWKMPTAVHYFITQFDRGENVSPFTFELEAA